MNVGGVQNRNQPNVQNTNSSAVQPLNARMGSRLCKFATGLAIVGMQPANNREQPAEAHRGGSFLTILGYIAVRALAGAALGALLTHKLHAEPDSISGACKGAWIGSGVAAVMLALNKFGNGHEAQE